MTNLPDKRTNAWRDDLADITLQSLVDASLYVEAIPAITTASLSSLRRGPSLSDPVDKELLRGEALHIYEQKNGWAWVQSLRDQYVGYCRLEDISQDVIDTTHRVNVLRSSLFKEANLKSQILDQLSLNSDVTVIKHDGKFSQLSCDGWIYTKHIIEKDQFTHSFRDTARLYLNSPYIWGGNGHLGVDCSGLIQMAAYASGHQDIPRDTDMQEDYFGNSIEKLEDMEIGDLLFWPGHVAIYEGNGIALHANATEMITCAHYLDFLLPHIEKQEGTPLRSIKRPDFSSSGRS